MNKTKATEGRESDSSFRLHPSAFKKVGRRSQSLACPALQDRLVEFGRCHWRQLWAASAIAA
jgi:hypothetical protein